jgi:hypothetical protein
MRRLQAIVRDEELTPAQSQERFRVAMSDHKGQRNIFDRGELIPLFYYQHFFNVYAKKHRNPNWSSLPPALKPTTKLPPVGSISIFVQNRHLPSWKMKSFSMRTLSAFLAAVSRRETGDSP